MYYSSSGFVSFFFRGVSATKALKAWEFGVDSPYLKPSNRGGRIHKSGI
jgi:hypothetical protein